jgi:hypothetical protein
LAAAFLGFALVHAADTKARTSALEKEQPVQAAGTSNMVAGNRASAIDVNPGEGFGATLTASPGSRYMPALSQAASPYILLHTGAREADQNGNWKNHIVNRAGGSVYMAFGVFDSGVVGRNNAYVLQCYNPLTGALTFPIGTEPNQPANVGPFGQNGGLDMTPAGRAVQAQRSTLGGAANVGSAIVIDGGACLGVLTGDTIAGPDATLPLDPDIVVLDETTYVAFIGPFNLLHMSSARTTDGGVTWSAATPVIQSSFLGISGDNVVDGDGNPNNDVVWAAAPGCQDSGCFLDYEEMLVTRSTDGGQSWMIPAMSPAGSFEFPAYHIMHTGGFNAMCVGDTFHVTWLDWADNSASSVGGHVHHMTVNPDLSVGGPRTAASINLPFTTARDLSAATGGTFGQGLGWGIWQHPSLVWNPDSNYMYILWTMPPPGPNGAYLDSTRGTTGASVRTYGNNDIFRVASRNNGRSWDAPINVTMTNNPGCTGPLDPGGADPCEHEWEVSAASRADSLIYVVAQVQTLPGFQTGTTADQGFPGVVNGVTHLRTIMADQWRLYKVPSTGPLIVAACGASGAPNPSNVHLLPAGPSTAITYILANTGLADLVLDSIRTSGTLNDGNLSTTNNAVVNTAIPELGSYSFSVTFNPAGVSPSEAGLRSGNVVAWVHTNDPVATNFGQAISCFLPATIYVVPTFCLFSNDSIHSGTNASRLGSSGCAGCATPGPSGFNDAMFYAATNDGYIFESAPYWVFTDTAAHTAGPDGVRWYFADQFLRCLKAYTVDSIPFGTGYNIYAKNVITGLEDSNIVAEVIWEQCTDPAYSDFLALTVKVYNVSGGTQNIAVGASCDADVPTGFNGVATPAIRFGPHNLSYQVDHVSAVDAKTYRITTWQGIDTLPGEFAGPPPRLCSGNARFFGILALPNGAASSSPVGALGSVTHSNRIISTGGWDDSAFVRNALHVGYLDGSDGAGFPETGFDTFFVLDSCDAAHGFPNGISTDVGNTITAKSVSLAPNPQLAGIVSRYGMEGLAASLDTATNLGQVTSYTVLYVAGIADSALWVEAVDSAISWMNQNAGQQVGGDLAPWHRNDLNDDGLLTSSDVVLIGSAVFLDSWANIPARGNIPPSACTADLNMDGLLTASDVVLSGLYTFLNQKPTTGYPNAPILMGCF